MRPGSLPKRGGDRGATKPALPFDPTRRTAVIWARPALHRDESAGTQNSEVARVFVPPEITHPKGPSGQFYSCLVTPGYPNDLSRFLQRVSPAGWPAASRGQHGPLRGKATRSFRQNFLGRRDERTDKRWLPERPGRRRQNVRLTPLISSSVAPPLVDPSGFPISWVDRRGTQVSARSLGVGNGYSLLSGPWILDAS